MIENYDLSELNMFLPDMKIYCDSKHMCARYAG